MLDKNTINENDEKDERESRQETERRKFFTISRDGPRALIVALLFGFPLWLWRRDGGDDALRQTVLPEEDGLSIPPPSETVEPVFPDGLDETIPDNQLPTPLLTRAAAETLGESPASQGDPSASQGDPSAAQGDPSASQGDPFAPQGDPFAPQGDPFAPQGDPSAPQGDPFAPQGNPFAPQGNPSNEPLVPFSEPFVLPPPSVEPPALPPFTPEVSVLPPPISEPPNVVPPVFPSVPPVSPDPTVMPPEPPVLPPDPTVMPPAPPVLPPDPTVMPPAPPPAPPDQPSVSPNALPRIISSNHISVPENFPAGGSNSQIGAAQSFHRIIVSDSDANDVLRFTIAQTNGAFGINQSDGTLWFRTTPDYETRQNYDLIVAIYDGQDTIMHDIRIDILNGNDPATGALTIDIAPSSRLNRPADIMVAHEYDVLTANTDAIMDADIIQGFEYQWYRGSVAIAGAMGKTYILNRVDIGENVAVRVSVTDKLEFSEMREAMAGIIVNVNDAPVNSVVIDITASSHVNRPADDTVPHEYDVLTANTDVLMDADGVGVFDYQWYRGNVAIADATNKAYQLTRDDIGFEVGVIVSYLDGQSTAETLARVNIGVIVNVNDDAVGAPSITGSLSEGSVLMAGRGTIRDNDGISGGIEYQWIRDNEVMSTGATYTLTSVDVGKVLTLRAGFTDDLGGVEMREVSTLAISNTADVADGAPSITGDLREDATLTAGRGTIGDGDGLTRAVFSYEWLRDGEAVGTGETYLLTQADVGKMLTLRARFTDDSGGAEMREATTGLIINVNDDPENSVVIDITASSHVNRPADETVPHEYDTLTANTDAITDEDGVGVFEYQWYRGNVAIAGATGKTHALTRADFDADVRVIVSYTDGQGKPETLDAANIGHIANVNDNVRGAVVIDVMPIGRPIGDTRPHEYDILTANTNTIMDTDGLGVFAYQWYQTNVIEGSPRVAVAGATGKTYMLTDADIILALSVTVSYTDGQGTVEMLTSANTENVKNSNDSPTGSVVVTTAPSLRANRPVGTEYIYIDDSVFANTDSIRDKDGLGAFKYQWYRSNVEIEGAQSQFYTITDADIGKFVSVGVSYIDGDDTLETLPRVNAGEGRFIRKLDMPPPPEPPPSPNIMATGAPVISGVLRQNAPLTASLGSVADENGGVNLATLSYTWHIGGSQVGSGVEFSLISQNYVGKTVTLIANFQDNEGNAESRRITPTDTIDNVNDQARGEPVIIGSHSLDSVLTGNRGRIRDIDGIDADTIEFVWRRDGQDIAMGKTYTLTQADVGEIITLRVNFEDNFDNPEFRETSTGIIAGTNNAPGSISIRLFPSIHENRPADETVPHEYDRLVVNTDMLTGVDIDMLEYQWIRNDADIIRGGFARENGPALTLAREDIGGQIGVLVFYTRADGTREARSAEVTGNVVNVPDDPEGRLTLSGFEIQGHNLRIFSLRDVVEYGVEREALAAIRDADTIPNGLNYRWFRLSNEAGGMPIEIEGAVGPEYRLREDDVGYRLRAEVYYTDGFNDDESLSITTGIIVDSNERPTAAPQILGTPRERVLLTADTSTIRDPDGFSPENITDYAWFLNSDTLIPDADKKTYRPIFSDVGSSLRVRVTYTDDEGMSEGVFSPSVRIDGGINDPSESRGSISSADVSGDFFEDTPVRVNFAIIDDDGFPLDDGSFVFRFNIVSPNGFGFSDATDIDLLKDYTQYRTVWERVATDDTSQVVQDMMGVAGFDYTPLQADVGATLRATVSFEDGGGHSETLTLNNDNIVQNVNDAPEGLPIIRGDLEQGKELAARRMGISDEDGINERSYEYQWYRIADVPGAMAVAIAGGTGRKYILTQADVGNFIGVEVAYTDNFGTRESFERIDRDEKVTGNYPADGSRSLEIEAGFNSESPSAEDRVAGAAYQADLLRARPDLITDLDGLPDIPVDSVGSRDLSNFTFTWLRDGVAIAGATRSSYQLVRGDVGKEITLRTSFTDALGGVESVEVSTPVVRPINTRPYFRDMISGDLGVGSELTARFVLGDTDGIPRGNGEFTENRLEFIITPGFRDYAVNRQAERTDMGLSPSNTFELIINRIAQGTDPFAGDDAARDAVFAQYYTSKWERVGLGPDVELFKGTGIDVLTYVLVAADIGSNIRWTLTYSDGLGFENTLSLTTGVVQNVVSGGAPGVSGDFTQKETLTATSGNINDVDGITAATVFSYEWRRGGEAVGTGKNYTLTQDDVGEVLTLRARFVDLKGNAETREFTTPTIGNINDLADGSRSYEIDPGFTSPFPDGTERVAGAVYETDKLRARPDLITDPDGLPDIPVDSFGAPDLSNFIFAWLRDGVEIAGATRSRYELVQADVGKVITLRTSFIDALEGEESVEVSTPMVRNFNNDPDATRTFIIDDKNGVNAIFILFVFGDTDGAPLGNGQFTADEDVLIVSPGLEVLIANNPSAFPRFSAHIDIGRVHSFANDAARDIAFAQYTSKWEAIVPGGADTVLFEKGGEEGLSYTPPNRNYDIKWTLTYTDGFGGVNTISNTIIKEALPKPAPPAPLTQAPFSDIAPLVDAEAWRLDDNVALASGEFV